MKYQRLLDEIAEVAIKHNRDPSEITLVTVTKNHPWQEVLPIYEAGCRNFGENKVQEALPKLEEAPKDIQWHFIGTLQKNKVKKVIGKFVLIHSVDSVELAQKISDDGGASILLEVNTSGEQSKHGFSLEQLLNQFSELSKLPNLKIEGLMTMAPLTDDEKIIHQTFGRLRELRDQLKLTHLSMGMSHDWPIAIEEGATLLRIGTALFEKL